MPWMPCFSKASRTVRWMSRNSGGVSAAAIPANTRQVARTTRENQGRMWVDSTKDLPMIQP